MIAEMENEYWRALIFFFTEKRFNATETEKELKEAHNGKAPSYSTIARWSSEYKRGRRSIQDSPKTGRPADIGTEENITRVQKMIEKDPRLTIDQIGAKTKISHGTVHKILNDELGLTKISARWVPKMLSNDDKANRTEISRRNLDRMNNDPEKFFDRIVTQDETWIHHFDSEHETNSMELRKKESQPSRKFEVVRSSGKMMASIFWDCDGIIMIHYLEKGKTANGKYYANNLVRLRECIKKKRRGKLRKGILLLHDNGPAQRAPVAQNSAQKCGFEILDHPAYSPDLAPSDFYLFPSMKKELKGQDFASNDEIVNAVEDFFEEKDKEYFKSGILKLRDRWSKCVEMNGDYVER